MPAIQYELSKEILPGSERPDFKYLYMIRERDTNASLVFRLFASNAERPSVLEVGNTVFYPEKFKDARNATDVFFSVDSFTDFMAAIERKNKI